MKLIRYLWPIAAVVLLASCDPSGPIPKVTKVVLNQTVVSLAEGDSLPLVVSFEPKGANENITWTSSNLKVATVSDKGVVKALSRGFALIKAQADSMYGTSEIQNS